MGEGLYETYWNCVIAEFQVLRDGLLFAFQLGISQLAIDLYAKIVVDLVLSKSVTNRAYSTLLNLLGTYFI